MSHKKQTLGEFIIENQASFKYSSGELSSLLNSIRLAAKIVNHEEYLKDDWFSLINSPRVCFACDINTFYKHKYLLFFNELQCFRIRFICKLFNFKLSLK